MKFIVTSAGMCVTTNLLTQPRQEVIDTSTNELFSDCETTEQVAEMFEYFWNAPKYAREIVRVFEVVQVNDDYLCQPGTTNLNNLTLV